VKNRPVYLLDSLQALTSEVNLRKANLTGRFLILVERYTGGPENGPKASARSIPSATWLARALAPPDSGW
jgi:hypothetical protein